MRPLSLVMLLSVSTMMRSYRLARSSIATSSLSSSAYRYASTAVGRKSWSSLPVSVERAGAEAAATPPSRRRSGGLISRARAVKPQPEPAAAAEGKAADGAAVKPMFEREVKTKVARNRGDYKIKSARVEKLYNDAPPSAMRALDGEGVDEPAVKNRPFTLPPGLFKPKQSLGQNFLSDQNYVEKIVNALEDSSEAGCRVVEIGPGSGAITRVLHKRFPSMTAIEIDQRAVKFLALKLPTVKVLHMNVLAADWSALAAERGGRLSVLGNLPYYITSQVLFSLADHHRAIDKAVVTMQLEVAERVIAKPRTKDYGIPSVVFQLYGTPSMNFKIPPTVFFPVPKVDSALITIDFTTPHPRLASINRDCLRKILTYSFQQRRKMLRVSLKDMMQRDGLSMPEKWSRKRPEELSPSDFLDLTADLYGLLPAKLDVAAVSEFYSGEPVWRVALFGDSAKASVDDEDEE